jgi:class 3 adenylate cyclase
VSDTTTQRRLLAIMFTDVVGYTALTERNEDAAVRVRDRHRELVQKLVGQFDGELVDATGDESLSIFPSARRAVDCALALQGALRGPRGSESPRGVRPRSATHAHNDGVPESARAGRGVTRRFRKRGPLEPAWAF